MQIKLQSCDGQSFPVDVEIAKKSITIKTMLEDLAMEEAGTDNQVPLPKVNAPILKKVIKWATQHKDDLPPPKEDGNTQRRTGDIPEWDQNFLKVDQGILFELIQAADYLDIKGLLDVTCKTVANMIKGKTSEQYGLRNFDTFPDIQEMIFFSLDYKSYKAYLEVNGTQLLTSERYITKGKSVFKEEVLMDEEELCIAARSNNTDKARRLLATGMVNVNVADKDGVTPLHRAAMFGHKEVAELLIESGASPNVVDEAGVTPLHWAANNGNNYHNQLDEHVPQGNGHKEVAIILLEHGADPNAIAESANGTTPLHWIDIWTYGQITSDDKDMAKILIDGGADPKKTDAEGTTPPVCANLSHQA